MASQFLAGEPHVLRAQLRLLQSWEVSDWVSTPESNDRGGGDILCQAALSGDVETMLFAIDEAGLDINAVYYWGDDTRFNSALGMALFYGRPEGIAVLLSHDATLKIQGWGQFAYRTDDCLVWLDCLHLFLIMGRPGDPPIPGPTQLYSEACYQIGVRSCRDPSRLTLLGAHLLLHGYEPQELFCFDLDGKSTTTTTSDDDGEYHGDCGVAWCTCTCRIRDDSCCASESSNGTSTTRSPENTTDVGHYEASGEDHVVGNRDIHDDSDKYVYMHEQPDSVHLPGFSMAALRELFSEALQSAVADALSLAGFEAEAGNDVWFGDGDGERYFDAREHQPGSGEDNTVICPICQDPQMYGLGEIMARAEDGLRQMHEIREKKARGKR
jgi:hypothetical protein